MPKKQLDVTLETPDGPLVVTFESPSVLQVAQSHQLYNQIVDALPEGHPATVPIVETYAALVIYSDAEKLYDENGQPFTLPSFPSSIDKFIASFLAFVRMGYDQYLPLFHAKDDVLKPDVPSHQLPAKGPVEAADPNE